MEPMNHVDKFRKILCIDDDPLIRKSIAAYLEDSGFQTLEAEDGQAGIELFRKETPDIVLLDLRMPKMNGFQALEVFRRESPRTPIIIISGTGEIQDVILALREGAWDFITKPIHDLMLVEHAISMAQERAILLRENQRYREHLEQLVEERTAALNKRTIDLETANQRLKKEIAEREEAEKELLHLFTAIEQAAEGIILVDKKNGSIRYLNSAFERITGYSQADLKGRPYSFLTLNTNYPQSYFADVWRRIKNGEVWSGAIINSRKDGTPCELEVSISPIRDSENNVIGFVSINRDVTQERQLERQLIRAQKMEAIGTLAGGIAHDFNNILSAIMGYAQLAMKRVADDEKARTHCEKVLMAGNRARELVSQILSISRSTDQAKKKIHVGPVVKEVIKLLRATLPANIEIQQQINVESDVVEGDPTHIHQMMMNLCTNAAHAMENCGGRLTVAMTQITQIAAPLPAGQEPSRALQLRVADTGIGIAVEHHDKIFEPYFTTKPPGKGTGLGLAVTRNIVEQLSGKISFESQLGKGTAFTIVLPLAQLQMEREHKVITRELPTGTERILLVDDEEALVDIGREILGQLGYTVIAKRSSREAVNAFKMEADRFDLIITDLFMPDMTGLELAKEIKSIRADIPIMLCTGIPSAVNSDTLEASGIRDLMIKPFLVSDLAERIRIVLKNSTQQS